MGQLWTWFWRIAAPLALLDIFLRRLPYARYRIPSHVQEVYAHEITDILKPGDVLLCRGDCGDSASVAGWSCSEFTHVAVIGPDKQVYDMTPIENERQMSLPDFVEMYNGAVLWRPIREEHKEWKEVPANLSFRETGTALFGATLSEVPVLSDFWEKVVAPQYVDTKSYCSEYVCTAMGLPGGRISNPKNFAPGGKYDELYVDELYYLKKITV